jgi:arylsulfatase A-like enzyme
MMEIDWSVGQIQKAIKEAGVENNTLVLFTSDNGPWVSYGNHSGMTPFRGSKATGLDGGIRSACLIKYPGHIKPGSTSTRTFSTLDLLPTFANLAGAKLPANPVDGKNVWDLITGVDGAENPHDYYPFSTGSTLEGILSGDGRWKLHLPHNYRALVTPGHDGTAGKYRVEKIGLSLFDMEQDPYETTNVLEKYPRVAARMQAQAQAHRQRFYPKQKP